jgi:prepilin-type N-terminal cleavage/methylation domain-containing protein
MRRVTSAAGQRGLTLLEVLAAVAILGLALTPMLVLMRDGVVAGRRIESLSRTVILATSSYEELRARIQSTSPPWGYEHDYGQQATPFPPPDEEYRLHITDDRAAGLRTVRITVWHDENGSDSVDGDEVPVILDTRIADRS